MTPPLLRFRPTTILTRGGGCAGDDADGVVGELGQVGEEGHQQPQAGEVGQPIVEQVGRHLLLRPPVPGAEMCQSSGLSQWPSVLVAGEVVSVCALGAVVGEDVAHEVQDAGHHDPAAGPGPRRRHRPQAGHVTRVTLRHVTPTWTP